MRNVKRHHLALLLFVSVILTNCGDAFSTTVDLDAPEFEEQLVVSSFGAISTSINNQLIQFFITRNVSVLEDLDLVDVEVEGAFITIIRQSDGFSINSLQDLADEDFNISTVGGLYSLKAPIDNFIIPGNNYTYIIEHPDFPRSETTIRCPLEEAVLSNIRYNQRGETVDDFENSDNISFDIIDNAGTAGFYQITANIVDNEGISNFPFFIQSFDSFAEKAFPRQDIFISDSSFDGETREVTVWFDESNFNPEVDSSIVLTLSSISEETFKFARNIDRSLATEDFPFTSPVQVTSNVNNALGNISLAILTTYEIIPR